MATNEDIGQKVQLNKGRTTRYTTYDPHDRSISAFVDDDEPIDRQVIAMLKGASIPFTIIPTRGGFPTVTYCRNTYTDLKEIREFISNYRIT